MKYKVLSPFFHRGILIKPGSVVDLPEGRAAGPHLQLIVEPKVAAKPAGKPTPDLTPPTTK